MARLNYRLVAQIVERGPHKTQGDSASLSQATILWQSLNNKYIASIRFNGTLIHLGYFKDPEEGARAYDKAALFYFGEFANLNFKDEYGG